MTLDMIKSLLGMLGLLLLLVEVTGTIKRAQQSADERAKPVGPLDMTFDWIFWLCWYGIFALVGFVVIISLMTFLLPDIWESLKIGFAPVGNLLQPYADGLSQIYRKMPYIFLLYPVGLYLVAIPISLFQNYPKFVVGLIGAVTTLASYYLDFILPKLQFG